MTLKQLEAFYWAANCASFAVAAGRLHLSISSLSKRINELELSLGLPLFDRTGHKAVLTETGQRLLPRAWHLLQEAEDIRQTIGQDTSLTGRCRLGVGEFTALTWLPRMLAMAKRAHPGLVLEPTVDMGLELQRKMQRGEFDFAIIAGRARSADMNTELIGEAEFSWVIAADADRACAAVTPALLQRFPVVTLPAGAGTNYLLNDWVSAHGQLNCQRLICNNWRSIAGLVASGVGVGLLPTSWARNFEQRGQLRILQSKPALGPLAYSFQWRNDDNRPLLRAMREIVHATVDLTIAHQLM
ncbi:MAG: LysR family transcriptional regulator [Pseudomonadota bacterium]